MKQHCASTCAKGGSASQRAKKLEAELQKVKATLSKCETRKAKAAVTSALQVQASSVNTSSEAAATAREDNSEDIGGSQSKKRRKKDKKKKDRKYDKKKKKKKKKQKKKQDRKNDKKKKKKKKHRKKDDPRRKFGKGKPELKPLTGPTGPPANCTCDGPTGQCKFWEGYNTSKISNKTAKLLACKKHSAKMRQKFALETLKKKFKREEAENSVYNVTNVTSGKLDGVSDDCGMKFMPQWGGGRGSGGSGGASPAVNGGRGRRLLGQEQVGEDDELGEEEGEETQVGTGRRGAFISLSTGYKRCNRFYSPKQSKPFTLTVMIQERKERNRFDEKQKQFKKPIFICQATKISTATKGEEVPSVSGGRGRRLLELSDVYELPKEKPEVSFQALQQEEPPLLGEAAQVTVGRRGKASTIRRAAGAMAMPMSPGGGGFQGNSEEELLGEASDDDQEEEKEMVESTQDVQALGVCEHSDALKEAGPTCAAAMIADLMVTQGIYKEGNMKHCEEVEKRDRKDCEARINAWKKANRVLDPKKDSKCLEAAKGKCFPAVTVEGGNRLLKQCAASLTAA